MPQMSDDDKDQDIPLAKIFGHRSLKRTSHNQTGHDVLGQPSDGATEYPPRDSPNPPGSPNRRRTALTPPLPLDAEHGIHVETLMRKSTTGERRWCRKCDAPKPDRCHHCRQCGHCVLKASLCT
jgi:palmitoyltransferase